MDRSDGFSYEKKTAIQALQELCNIRKYPQPLYLDRSQSNKIMVTTVVGGKIYGSAEGKSVAEACEQAAIATLKIWLKDSFNPSLLLQKTDERIQEPQISSAQTTQADTQLNAVSLLHVFTSSLLHDAKPDYDVNKVDEKFFCELTLLHESKTLKTQGEGKTKVLAKRVAAFSMLQHLFPNLHTLEQFSDAINAAIESKRNEKKNSKSTKKTLPPKVLSIEQIPDTKDELTDTVHSVISNLQKFNISPPQNYSFRVAVADDVDSVLHLIKELAIYEKSADCMSMTRETLLRDGWGVNRKYPSSIFRPDFYVYLVEYNSNGVSNAVGMALFYQVYSTWKGRSIHLEDLFVLEPHRAVGLGTLLMRLVGAVVDEMNMTRYGWVCLHWNEKPRRFYNSLGTTELNEWISIRMENESIKKFVYYGRVDTSPKEAENPQTTPSTSLVSWNDRFAEARKIGNECDKDVVNFHPHHNNHSEKSDGEVEEGEDEETLDDSGGFCQPASLATFVANELTQQNEEQLSPRMKRSHYACSIQEEVDVKRCRGD